MNCGYCSTRPARVEVTYVVTAAGEDKRVLTYPLCLICMGDSARHTIHDATETAPIIIDVRAT